ncbi:hypothetical protein F5887DRAFT_1062250 [Amanita rubescens]|nr:hypothetical protein F5887DRAFT_1062250 [Amanita rubescens]
MLKERYRCPWFRILIIGRANAGKTTILEKICGVKHGTKPIIYDQNGIHDIEHQITYQGSNFIFHDSQGFESGASEELEHVWNFIDKRSAGAELKDQLHAIWYCIPMDSPRPLLSTEVEFFDKGTGKVPLVVVFTKFDGQIIQEAVHLKYFNNEEDKWDKARKNADNTFHAVYVPKVFSTKYPPKAYVRLEDMDVAENNCPELTKRTADAIDDTTLYQLFISTQRNNLDLCVKASLQ